MSLNGDRGKKCGFPCPTHHKPSLAIQLLYHECHTSFISSDIVILLNLFIYAQDITIRKLACFICHDMIIITPLFSHFTHSWGSSLPKEPCAFVLPITNGSSLWPKCQWSIRCRPRVHTGFITVVEVTPVQPTTKAHLLAQCRPCQLQQTLLLSGDRKTLPQVASLHSRATLETA